MKFSTRAVAVTALLGLTVGAASAAPRIKLRKEVDVTSANWIMGFHLGERRGQAFPFVVQVSRKSPAWFAGLREGDEIVRVQDQPSRGLEKVTRELGRVPDGRRVKLHVRRSAQEIGVEFIAPARHDERMGARDRTAGEDPGGLGLGPDKDSNSKPAEKSAKPEKTEGKQRRTRGKKAADPKPAAAPTSPE